MPSIKTSKQIYESAYAFLIKIKPKSITDHELAKYLEETYYASETISDIMVAFLSSLQNYQSAPNVIKFRQNMDQFRRILFDFDPPMVLSNFSIESLHDAYHKAFAFPNRDNKRSIWYRFSKGTMSIARFLSQYQTAEDFHAFVNQFTSNQLMADTLPRIIQDNIHGYGYALACDVLKELGYTQYSKPDTHLVEVFQSIGLTNGDIRSTVQMVQTIAEANGITPYRLDKIIWLICSGRYYLHKIKVPSRRAELVLQLRDTIGNVI